MPSPRNSEELPVVLLDDLDIKLSIPRYVNELESLVALLQRPTAGDNASAAGAEPTQYRVLIVAHNLGAIIAMYYAAKYPENIRDLALLGPSQ
ncbi:hypothetical protein UA08_01827 [Talaromyces atroroseus]|uniref:AB hydrolase-1 domain-containing protein n=1 Tax=Talaromyces atroroseus TaxID=1441469 RepID=A0A1Q5QC80_TALAT|nr:hypothetical protein UA08_01827 [Talaromyces atroroseus]OKL63428.1 hypothetical protein UA08_01827 [Talaromyces atroroseus]